MTKGKKYYVSCDDCSYLIVKWDIEKVKSYDCILLRPDYKYRGKKRLSSKKKKKIKRALQRYIRTGLTKYCPYFSDRLKAREAFTRKSIGKKATDFIKDRIEC